MCDSFYSDYLIYYIHIYYIQLAKIIREDKSLMNIRVITLARVKIKIYFLSPNLLEFQFF